MIEVGTKLKSSRSGEIVEVIALQGGAKKVRKQDGTEKILTDSNIARWYDEVTEDKVEPKEEVKVETKVKTVGETLNKMYQPKNNKQEKKKEKSVLIGAELLSIFKEFLNKNKFEGYEKKQYSGVLASGKCICHFHAQRKKIKFEFKPSDICEKDKGWLLKYPDNFRVSYCYYINVTDVKQLEKILNFLMEIYKKEIK